MRSDPCIINNGDTTWVLFSSVLVLSMMPALAFFEAGLLRTKNTLSIVSQVLGGMVVLSSLWVLFGYSLTFSRSYGGVIGNLDKSFMMGGACIVLIAARLHFIQAVGSRTGQKILWVLSSYRQCVCSL
jgi:ammonia channel protein AmtB